MAKTGPQIDTFLTKLARASNMQMRMCDITRGT